MRGCLQIGFVVALFGCAVSSFAADTCNYGLYFRSHTAPWAERTSLYLDDGVPFAVKNRFAVSFKMQVRGSEPDFGSILHLKTNTGQIVRFSFVSGEQRHYPALVLDEGMVTLDMPIERGKWSDVMCSLRVDDNVVEIEYDGKRASATVPLQGTTRVEVLFGKMENYLADVAPFNLRDVRVIQDGTTIRQWKLHRHDDEICYDEMAGAAARAVQSFWLIDSHIEWKELFRKTLPEGADLAFDARKAEFYVVMPQAVEVWNQEGLLQRRIPVGGGYRAVEYPDHLLFDTVSNRLFSYFPTSGAVSYFSFDSGRWSLPKRNAEEPETYNHALTFDPADSSFYFFGGYGFYQYRNDLFRLKSGAERVERIGYELPFAPRYSAAAAIVGDDLYIFGGRGNKYGKQELTTNYYLGLCALNLKSRKSRLVWEKANAEERTIMASSMYFEPADSSFYAVSMEKGGVLWKISMRDSVYTEVSKPIRNERNYQDCDFTLYASPAQGKMFLVLDKILNDKTHDVAAYSIDMPLIGEADICQTPPQMPERGNLWSLLIPLSVSACIVAGGVFIYRRNRKRRGPAPEAVPRVPRREAPSPVQSSSAEPVIKTAETTHYYDCSRSSILLTGTFRVFDREGTEITTHFTPRLKQLLILLILYSEKYRQGILVSKVTDILWPDKDGNSARNNRNVSLRKLRVLLEHIGEVEIVSESNFLRIEWGRDVFCDYHELLTCIAAFKQNESDGELLGHILELLLYGPLLPNTIFEWLDNFKDDYSSLSIDLLKNQLEVERQRNNQEMILRIADIVFLHDPLSEEALAAKCDVLSAQGKNGIARNVYDRFCKEYRKSIGEEFGKSFSEL